MADTTCILAAAPAMETLQNLARSAAANSKPFGSLSPSSLPSSSQSSLDLTAIFDHAILTILPTAILIASTPFHFFHYRRQPTVAPRSELLWCKLFVACLLMCLEMTKSFIWSTIPDTRTDVAAAGSTLSCLAAFCISIMLLYEHRHSTQSSLSLSVYLSIVLVVDIVKTRSYLIRPELHVVGAVSSALVVTKLMLIVLQEVPKQPQQKHGDRKKKYSSEATGGFWNRTLALWLNTTLLFGFKQTIRMSDLANLGPDFSSRNLSSRFEPVWAKSRKLKEYSLMLASFRVLFWPYVFAALPRILVSAFTFILPQLMKRILQQIQKSDAPLYIQNTLIMATALLFACVAVSRASYSHLIDRVAVFMRGLLVSQILAKNLKLKHTDAKQSAALTLMSTDVEGILDNVRTSHDIWLSGVEISASLYFISTLINEAFFLPMFPIFISAGVSWQLSKRMVNASEVWTENTERRISKMSGVLSQIKGIKITGIEPVMTDYVQSLRQYEMRSAEKARKLNVWLIAMLPIDYWFTPITVVGGGLFWTTFKDGLDPVTIFVTLAYVNLLAEPMTTFLKFWPNMGTMYACFKRIQQFLMLPEREDPREVRDFTYVPDMPDYEKNGFIAEIYEEPVPDSQKRCVSLLDTSVANEAGTDILKHIQLSILIATLVMVVGPVGVGKSMFLKSLIGESVMSGGAIHVSHSQMAYCDQRAWIPDTTIRKAIVGEREFDAAWYTRVIRSCLLDYDIRRLVLGDQTRTGPNGSRLSGGQKQRIAIARAVYSGAEILVLDDVLSALDIDTAEALFARLLSPNGLLKEQNRTVILATHSIEFLNDADQVFVVDKEGNVKVDTETYEPGASDDREAADVPANGEAQDREHVFEQEQLAHEFELEDLLAEPTGGDFSLYTFLFSAIPKWLLLAFILNLGAVAILERMPEIYVRIWIDIDPTNKSYFIGLACLALSAMIINGSAAWIYMLVIMPQVALALHKQYLETVMTATLPFLTTANNGALLNRFSQDMSILSQELPMAFYRFVYMTFLATADTIMIGSGARYAALMIPVILVVLYLLQLFYLRTSRQMRVLDLAAKAPLYAKVSESITGLEHIRAFGWEKKCLSQSLDLLDYSQKSFYYLYCLQRWLLLVLDLIAGFIAVILVTIALNWKETTTQPALGLALLGLLSYSLALRNLVRNWTNLETSLGAVARLRRFVQTTPVERDGPGVVKPANGWPLEGTVKFTNVGARYSTHGPPIMAVEDFSLTVKAGQKAIIKGRTGSGKSSSILTLLNFLPYTGSVTIDGVEINKIPRADLRHLITTIPQDHVDIPGSVLNNLLPMDIMKPAGEEGKVNLVAVRAVLVDVELWDHIRERGGLLAPIERMNFSAGQRQLLSLARGILHNIETGSKIVIMDEATSSMDYQTEKRMATVINDAFGTSTQIVIAHRPATYFGCSYIFEMEGGRVIVNHDQEYWQQVATTEYVPDSSEDEGGNDQDDEGIGMLDS